MFKNLLLDGFSLRTPTEKLFWFFGGAVLVSLFGAAILDIPYLAGLPIALLLLYVAIVDYRQLYFLLLLCVPLSIEVYLPGGFGTDLPTEPLLVGLMFIYLIHTLQRRPQHVDFFRHPLVWLLSLHFFWIIFTTFFSDSVVVSIKYLLAKTWYIVVYVFLTGQIIQKEAVFKKIFWLCFLSLCLGALIVLVRFRSYGFAFESVNEPMSPFFRNHVDYASILTLFFPFVAFASTWYRRYSFRWWILLGGLLLLLIGIQFSYTRTAYVALFIGIAAYFAFKWRLIRYAIGGAVIFFFLGITWVLNHNRYLNFAPDYDKTITHYEFDDLINATYKFQDISTMERVYRWVAGYQMIQDQKFTGVGPGNFYNFYRSYTLASFRTYVSNNPEKSGIHNYYLMVWVEQGIVGFLLFLLLTFGILLKGEIIYHQTPLDRTVRRSIIMAALVSLVIIDAFLLINDLIEAAKVGSFYFINIALLINMDLFNRREKGVVNRSANPSFTD